MAVNLLWMAPGRVGGSEQYLTRQLRGLPVGDDVEVELYVQPAFATAHPDLAGRFEVHPLPFRRDVRGARMVAEHTWLSARARGADVVHHGGGTAPIGGRRPILLTIHDLQYLAFPQYFARARRDYLRVMMPRSVRRSALIATPSDYVRGTVIDAFDVPPERVVVVPHGVPDTRPPGHAERDAVLRPLGLTDRPYVVYPAITHPHKGHRLLVDMLSAMDEPDLALVLIGGEGAAEADLRRAIASAGVDGRVVRPGRVGDAARDAIVAGAQALVFPSEYEGFGAPLVEAMLLGVPVVASAHPAVREVVGDGGVIVEERSGSAWAAAVGGALARREELIAAGHRRAPAFSLDRSGTALADAYRRVAAARP